MSEIDQLVRVEDLEQLPRRARKKQETRWRIFEAAVALMSERGFDDVKIEEICAAADVASATFFHHFSSKAALVRAFLDKLHLRIREQLADNREKTANERLALVLGEVAQIWDEHAAFAPNLFAAFSAESSQGFDFHKPDSGLMGMVSEIVKDGQKSGEFKPEVNPHLVAISVVGLWSAMAMARTHSAQPASLRASKEETLALVLHGISNG
ncbi:MAG: TetR/AcrR family transcriptional regulator [Parvibaculaceae bacterium]|nr:TetR/AcrR family transcriptional regulator [Parvibaculaceae bacterium]HBM89536.1 TetR/AcrR family transcriptional regulator [Rhodobiaceae bacterium]|tara:strand:+ start:815 stop:1447 length:633 start_codon:yes stop_codon:yes gene_type:complete